MLIPKRMAFIWHDGRLSWLRYLSVATFCRLNPDWSVRLYHTSARCARAWTSGEAIDAEDYHGPDYTDLLGDLDIEHVDANLPRDDLSPVHASDLMRFKYLGTDGGWYSDLDILYVRPMAEIKRLVSHAGIVLSCTGGVVGIGFLAGLPNYPLWQSVYENALSHYKPDMYQSCGVHALHGLVGTLQRLKRAYKRCSVVDLPSSVVYPWDHTQTAAMFEQDNPLPPDCIGIHWFGGHPTSQRWNNVLTRHNCRRYTNTITRCIAESSL